MDVHPPKNGMYRYWSIAKTPSGVFGLSLPILHWKMLPKATHDPVMIVGHFLRGRTGKWLPPATSWVGQKKNDEAECCHHQKSWWTFNHNYSSRLTITYFHPLFILYIYIYLWVNYHISPTWIKAKMGWFPLLTIIFSEGEQWGRYNLPRYIYIYIYIISQFNPFFASRWCIPRWLWAYGTFSAPGKLGYGVLIFLWSDRQL